MSIKAGFGWTGNILHIDLTRAIAWRENLPASLLEGYLGGRGLAVRLMRDYFKLDPFDPQMPLIFACGPLCGTCSRIQSALPGFTFSLDRYNIRLYGSRNFPLTVEKRRTRCVDDFRPQPCSGFCFNQQDKGGDPSCGGSVGKRCNKYTCRIGKVRLCSSHWPCR
jgi:hypothetical protein